MAPPNQIAVNPLDELTSITRPSDVNEYAFDSVPGGYKNQALALSGQEAKAHDNAINYLRDALNKSENVTPSQGFAAALLAAIPTLGGYLVGKAVPSPVVPKGTYFKDPKTFFDNFDVGGNFAAAQGAGIGNKVAGGYLGGIKADQDQDKKVLEQLAGIEANKAERAQGAMNSTVLSGLAQQAELDKIPLEENSMLSLS